MAVKIEKLIEDLELEVLVKGMPEKDIDITDINRPGLQLAGYYSYFANKRIQVMGRAEWSYLDTMQVELRNKRIKKYFKFDIPCIIISRGLEPHSELMEHARKSNVWVLRSKSVTTRLISRAMSYLDRELAAVTRIHGVLVDVYGIGILITGESGIGKSETALELIKRGHRLVSDDAVDIKSIDGVLYGTAPYITSGMMEVRGMGIIDVPALYGMSSILDEKSISFVISLEPWKKDENYDRLGIDNENIEILDTPVKKIKLPIRPGRNIAVIIEAAAANYRYGLISDVSPVETINNRIFESNNKNEKQN